MKPILLMLLAVSALLLLSAHTVTALPFSASSGVTELTPATLPGFLNTHKPVFIVFYAPWCGHCKQIHPEWEKFAKSVKDVVRVGAVNADEHRDLGGQYGIKGFPTIKYWKMGNKKGMAPMDYQQARSASALQSAAMAEIHAKGVVTAADESTLRTALSKATSGKAVVLFTEKKKSPPILSVLSQSPHFLGKVSFLMVTSSAKALVQSFGVEKFPSVFVVSTSQEGDELTKEAYTGPMDYTSIAKHLQQALGIEVKEERVKEDKKQQQQQQQQSKGGAKGRKSTETSTGTEETGDDAAPPAAKAAPKPSLPVRPVPFSAALFPSYCGSAALRLKGQAPLCIISFSNAVNLNVLHEKFGNEPLLFFDGVASVDDVAEQFSQQLGAVVQAGDVLLIRAFKSDSSKFFVIASATDDAVETVLSKIAGGDIAMKKSSTFPAIQSATSD